MKTNQKCTAKAMEKAMEKERAREKAKERAKEKARMESMAAIMKITTTMKIMTTKIMITWIPKMIRPKPDLIAGALQSG